MARGSDEATVKRVIAMVDKNEYKRRQGPIGIKITPRAFGKDWRLPSSTASSSDAGSPALRGAQSDAERSRA